MKSAIKQSLRKLTKSVAVYLAKHPAWHFLERHSLVPAFARRLVVIEAYQHGQIEGPARVLEASGDTSDPRFARILEIRERLLSEPPQLAPRSSALRPPNKNVLFALHHSHPHNVAGYSVRTRHIIENLATLGINITSVTRPGFPWHMSKPPSDIALEDEVDGIRYSRIPSFGLKAGKSSDRQFISGYAEALAPWVENYDCSALHSASNYIDGLAGAAAARATGARSIYEVRGLWYLSQATRKPSLEGSPRTHYEELMEIEAMNASDQVVTLSRALSERIQSWGISAEKITEVPNAVDTDWFKPLTTDKELRKQLGLEDCLVVGFVGSIQEYEGLDTLVEAVSKLRASEVKIRVVIVGDGPAFKKLKATVQSCAVADNVMLIGRVPFEQVARYYSILDVCVFPRKDYEVCRLVPPLKILEAMAMEKAVIVSDVAPLLEMVEAGKAGLVFRAGNAADLAESLMALAGNPILRASLAKSARKWVIEHRSWKKIAERYLHLYGL